MEFLSSDGFSLGSIVAGVVSTVVLIPLRYFAKFLYRYRFTSRIYFYLTNNFYGRTVVFLTISLFVSFLIHFLNESHALGWISPFGSAMVSFSILVFLDQWRFARIGLHGAQLAVSKGTDYESSLNICRDNFCFLGTGASKLTSARNFEQTILRCGNANSKVRFLLSRPDNPIIVEAERMAGATPSEYSHAVKNSLKILKKLKFERDAKIDVRFYKADGASDFENFRMMFVDDAVLLLSYNVYGRGSGSDLPQIVLIKNRLMPSSRSFYLAYQNYFDRLWQSSETWDFNKYVEE